MTTYNDQLNDLITACSNRIITVLESKRGTDAREQEIVLRDDYELDLVHDATTYLITGISMTEAEDIEFMLANPELDFKSLPMEKIPVEHLCMICDERLHGNQRESTYFIQQYKTMFNKDYPVSALYDNDVYWIEQDETGAERKFGEDRDAWMTYIQQLNLQGTVIHFAGGTL